MNGHYRSPAVRHNRVAARPIRTSRELMLRHPRSFPPKRESRATHSVFCRLGPGFRGDERKAR